MFVLFLDLLGFASAVSSLSEEDNQAFIRSVQQSAAFVKPIPLEFASIQAQKLYSDYFSFQKTARHVVRMLEQEVARKNPEQPGNIRSVLFSDSLFLACDDIGAILTASCRLYFELLLYGPIPCRGGISKGSFASFDWTVRAAEGGRFHAEAPFLGTGVVTSYYAESKGAHGLRLVLHKNAYKYALEVYGNPVIPLPSYEQSDYANSELNLLWQPWHDIYHPEEGFLFIEKKIIELKSNAPTKIHKRYDATLSALHRMREFKTKHSNPKK